MSVTTRGDGDEKLVCEKHERDGSGESVLSGFGSSSGSSTDETSDQEEFIAELTRQMAENMLQEDDDDQKPISNKPKTTHFNPNQNQGKKYRHQNEAQRNKMKEYGNGSSSRRAGFLSSALQNGSGMRVVFLGDAGSSSGGTGVFIPHATNNLPDHQPRKKPGRCPTVLIPERVLQTLKQHFEKRNANSLHAHQNQSFQPNETIANNDDFNNQELQLPQEWTY